MSEVQVYTLATACRRFGLKSVKGDYHDLLAQLHGPGETYGRYLAAMLKRGSLSILILLYQDECLVGSGQADVVIVSPKLKIHIENIVIDESMRGQGLGILVMDALMLKAKAKCYRLFSQDTQLCFQLTNSPSKGNAGFYESLGFRSRTVESGDPTVVWVKE